MPAVAEKTSAAHQYRLGTLVSMAAYIVTVMAAAYLTSRDIVSGPVMYVVAVLPGLAICGQIAVTLRYLRDADEFVRTLTAKRLIVASMATLAAFTVWGFLETFAHTPHLVGWWAYPMMWFLLGVVSCFIRSSK